MTKFHFTKDLIEKQEMKCIYCPSGDMVADLMTKPLQRIRLEKLAKLIGLTVTVKEDCGSKIGNGHSRLRIVDVSSIDRNIHLSYLSIRSIKTYLLPSYETFSLLQTITG